MDPLRVADALSVKGVDSPARTMAVRRNGQILFKKNASELCYYDIQELTRNVLRISKLDPLYDDCQIFDIAFDRNDEVVFCLQRPSSGELFVCRAYIDSQEHSIQMHGAIHKTNMFAAPRRNVVLLHDEVGIVLISYPIKWLPQGNKVELFHVSNFLSASAGDKFTISLSSNDKLDQMVFSNPFVSRNHLYLFSATDFSRFLLVPLSGTSCGKASIRSTNGIPPSKAYIMKQVQAFEDSLLVYAHMNTSITIKPNFYALQLNSLKWVALDLSLSNHYPNGKVSMQKCGEDTVYLHGECNVPRCDARSHLYQIDVSELPTLSQRERASSLPSTFSINLIQPAAQKYMVRNSRSSDSPPVSPCISDNTPPTFVPSRYKKKTSKEEYSKRRYSSSNLHQSSGSLSKLCEEDGPLKRCGSLSSLHWSADMAEQSGQSLQEQLKLAHDMGYSDGAIFAALNMNQKMSVGEEQSAEGLFCAFESTNSMLDLLQQATSKNAEKSKLSVFDDKSTPTSHRSARSNVSRSSSFHLGSPRMMKHESHDMHRLIHTLEKEKERDKKEVDEQFARLKSRIHDLERECGESNNERTLLRREVLLKTEHSDRTTIERDKLQDENEELKLRSDRLELENCRIQREIQEKKELLELRKKQFEEEIVKKDERATSLDERCNDLQRENAEMKHELVELKEVNKQYQDNNSRLQPAALLEAIGKEMKLHRERREEEARHNDKIEQLFAKFFATYPLMEEEMKKLDRKVMLQNEEICARNREINRLMEKNYAECCICLTMKPSMVFLPCRHLVACEVCVAESTIEECPTCRSKIHDSIKVYF